MTLGLAYLIVGGVFAIGWGLVRGLHAAAEGRNPSLATAIFFVGVLCLVFVWYTAETPLTWRSPTEAALLIWVTFTR